MKWEFIIHTNCHCYGVSSDCKAVVTEQNVQIQILARQISEMWALYSWADDLVKSSAETCSIFWQIDVRNELFLQVADFMSITTKVS